MSELWKWTACELSDAVRTGCVTASEIVQQSIARRHATEPFVHAWISLNDQYLEEQAEVIDAQKDKGPLSGVLFGIKDVFNTEILPTGRGSVLWQGYKAGNDARCVSNIRRSGGLIAGKTDTAEFAVHTPGQSLNPYNVAHVTGTSSGGSAVAVAVGMTPAALGTQTLGSTIRPGSWCGVYAMKPSFGLIPRTGVLKTTDTLDNIGFYGRSVKDLRLILESIRLRGKNFPCIEKNFHDAVPEKYRIGLYRTHFWDDTISYARKALEQFAQALRAIPWIEVVDVDFPESVSRVHDLHRRIYNPCLAYYFREELSRDRSKISPCFLELVEDGRKFGPEDYALALREQETLSHLVHDTLFNQRIDAIVSLASNGAAPKGTEPSFNADINVLWTTCWMPAINVPLFHSPQDLPFGALFSTRRYHDLRLLTLLERLVQDDIIPSRSRIAEPQVQYSDSCVAKETMPV